eukprot:PhM_4_TR15197/c0_g1_i2/m.93750
MSMTSTSLLLVQFNNVLHTLQERAVSISESNAQRFSFPFSASIARYNKPVMAAVADAKKAIDQLKRHRQFCVLELSSAIHILLSQISVVWTLVASKNNNIKTFIDHVPLTISMPIMFLKVFIEEVLVEMESEIYDHAKQFLLVQQQTLITNALLLASVFNDISMLLGLTFDTDHGFTEHYYRCVAVTAIITISTTTITTLKTVIASALLDRSAELRSAAARAVKRYLTPAIARERALLSNCPILILSSLLLSSDFVVWLIHDFETRGEVLEFIEQLLKLGGDGVGNNNYQNEKDLSKTKFVLSQMIMTAVGNLLLTLP